MNWYKRQLKMAMPKAIQWSKDDLQVVKSLIEEGHSFKDVAGLFGVSRPTISALNDEYGWRPKGVPGPTRIFLSKVAPYEERIIDLYNQGLSTGDISKGIDKALSTREIRYFLTSRGLKEKTPQDKIKENILEKGRQMVNMYLSPPRGQGMTLKEISILFNITTNVVKDYMKRTGLISDEDFRSEEEVYKGQSKKMLEWWKQWEGDDGAKFKNCLLSYPTRQQAINLLRSLVNNRDIRSSGNSYAIYSKYMKIINNHTFPDEIQQNQPSVT